MEARSTRREVLIGGAAAAAGVALASRTSAASDDVLRELLTRNREHSAVYAGGLANHLSMELIALHRLGASGERLREFAGRYGRALDPFPQGAEVEASSWKTAIGHRDAFAGLERHFERELARRGRDEVLREVLPELARVSGSQAFHGSIRCAYALDAGDDAELAHGLAYWAGYADDLGPLSAGAKSDRRPVELLARARESGSARLPGNSVTQRMLAASKRDGFAELASGLVVDEHTLDEIALAMVALYAATRDFTALHAVTGTHALRLLLPFAPDREAMLRRHWQALTAAYLAIGAPAMSAESSVDAPAWDAIAAQALPSDDDHHAKFVYSCRSEETARASPLYRVSAARRVGLL